MIPLYLYDLPSASLRPQMRGPALSIMFKPPVPFPPEKITRHNTTHRVRY